MSDKFGQLILLSTPIGNLEDISKRAMRYLEETTFLVAEDTRKLKELLKHLEVKLEGKQIFSFHDHSEQKQLDKILSLLEEKNDVVLVSDAGSPIVSDPAYPLVRACVSKKINIESIPGASSLVVAMELSGLRPLPCHFYGFLPREKNKRMKFFEQCFSQEGSHYFFEGVSRVEESLALISKNYPEHSIAVMRELTKKFQSIYRFKGSEFLQGEVDIDYRGEFVIAVEVNKGEGAVSQSPDVQALAKNILDKGARPKDVAKLVASILALPVKEVYSSISQE